MFNTKNKGFRGGNQLNNEEWLEGEWWFTPITYIKNTNRYVFTDICKTVEE